MFQTQVPKKFLGGAMLTTTYLIINMPSHAGHSRTPWSLLKPTNDPFPFTPRTFGCSCFIHTHGYNVGELNLKETKGVFLWYFITQKDYKYLNPNKDEWYVTIDIVLEQKVTSV